MVERSLSMREVPGSIPGASRYFLHFVLSFQNFAKSLASSGNRTRAARVAGEHSTTEPTMPHRKLLHFLPLQSKMESDGDTKNIRSRQDSNLRSQRETDFQSVALTTRPQLPYSISRQISHVTKHMAIIVSLEIYRKLTSLPGQLSRQSMRLLISGSWVRAPRWAQLFFSHFCQKIISQI